MLRPRPMVAEKHAWPSKFSRRARPMPPEAPTTTARPPGGNPGSSTLSWTVVFTADLRRLLRDGSVPADCSVPVIHRLSGHVAVWHAKQRQTESMRKVLHMPLVAVWLGVGGLIPFVTLSGSSLVLSGTPKTWAVFAIGGYGAVILSFLGGIQWGLAMGAGSRNGRDDTSAGRLVLMPSGCRSRRR